jgi:uncharacterized alkaline shock family protein YloU
MTDVAPTQRTGNIYQSVASVPAGSAPASDDSPSTAPAADPPSSSDTAPSTDTGSSTLDDVKERAGEVLDKAGDAVQDAAGKAYEATKEAAGNLVTRIRNNATLPAERGTTTIGNEVVEKIAGIAARDVPGVYDLGGDAARFVTSVREKLHLGEESAAQGVGVKLEGKQAEIEVVLVLEYGFQVHSVTEKVREKVISAVESLLGLDVTAVDIVVDDIHVDEKAHSGDDAARAATYQPETRAIVVGEANTAGTAS